MGHTAPLASLGIAGVNTHPLHAATLGIAGGWGSFFTLLELMAANQRSLLSAYAGLWSFPAPAVVPTDLDNPDVPLELPRRLAPGPTRPVRESDSTVSGTALRIGLAACSETKADQPTLACALYVPPLFRAARAYAEQSYDAWLILSAKHGALAPTTLLAPYDFTLTRLSYAQRHAWAVQVVGQLAAIFGDLHRCAFGIHAGLGYRDPLGSYLPSWSAPLQGLGIGQQLAWYRRSVGLTRREMLIESSAAPPWVATPS